MNGDYGFTIFTFKCAAMQLNISLTDVSSAMQVCNLLACEKTLDPKSS